MGNLLDIKDERLSFFTPAGEVKALGGVSFSMKEGDVLGIVGESGSGKSVTSYSVMGLTAHPGRLIGGSIEFNGHRIDQMSEKEMRRIRGNEVSIIFQDPMTSLNPVLTVGDQILEALELMPFVKQHPSTLSGGQKQRLALGVALMHEVPIIILDEPTSGLDGTNMRNVSRMIRKLAKMGRTIIVITHDAECALACCERAIRLENGCITDDFQIRGAELLLDKIGYDKKEG